MLTPDELHNVLIGKQIDGVETLITESNDIYKVELRLTDGTVITLSPTSFNYGGQHLNVDIS